MAKKRKKKSGDDSSKSKSITFVKKRRSTPRRNPEGASVALLITDLASQAVPVVISFAGTHVLAHVVGDRLLGGRSWSRHVKVATAALAIVGAYFAGHVKQLEKYQTGALVGSTLAALQTAFQAYIPQVSWILGGQPAAFAPMLAAPQPKTAAGPQASGDDDDDDDADDDLSDLQGIFTGAGAGSGWGY